MVFGIQARRAFFYVYTYGDGVTEKGLVGF